MIIDSNHHHCSYFSIDSSIDHRTVIAIIKSIKYIYQIFPLLTTTNVTYYPSSLTIILDSIVVSISACHAEDPGCKLQSVHMRYVKNTTLTQSTI